ncbi:Heat shock protein HslJ [Roseovarius azorensis]|uniref:Heat shock protein HslJ n=1 Tax=Roseovarius azorensis TaxID=1287727 RepID=A0A1H7Q1N4_9RHOB|nr:META domain-containing protein [Roseovarius azorensis]SEL41873.1 Heat shock protein HslJ [Roseovarius azorensis]
MPRSVILAGVLAFASPLPAPAQEDGTRSISGGVGYMQRIALPPEARATVIVEGRFGSRLGQTTVDADGQQVPLPFELRVPEDLAGQLSAVIRVHGQPRWILQNVSIGAGTGPVDLHELILEPVTPMAFATEFVCGDVTVSVGVLGAEMVLRAEGRDIPLMQVEAASGARYQGVRDPETEVWNKGDNATIRLEGRNLPDCLRAVPPEEAPYRARGNEPGWMVVLAEQAAEITADYGEITHNVPRPGVQAIPGAYLFDMPAVPARLTIRETLCRDDATGMPYPDSAELALDDRVLRGCGGDPADLLIGPAWQVTALGQAELVEPERLSLNFITPGRVAGSSGCNRLVGGFTLTGEGLQFGAMGSTLMACPEPLMEQERRMLDALEQITRFDISEDGALQLIGGDHDAVLIEARRP